MGISTLIKTQTASGSDYLDFIDGTSSVVFDSTYDEYMFVFTDINPATDAAEFVFQVNATDDAGGDFDASAITSTFFRAHHKEDDSESGLDYTTGADQGQGTAFQYLAENTGNGSDESLVGIFQIFSPSSTTYVKQFYATTQSYEQNDRTYQAFIAGYINDTTAIDEIRFKMSTGAFDGVIQMYGIA
jgi:hypothetical protein